MVNRTRRSFLKRQLILGGCVAAGFDVISGPAQAASTNGYKALVCINLAGGNDSYNMFVPTSASAHADYATARQFLAVPRAQALPVTPATYSDGQAYGFHPAMGESKRLFDSGQLAVMANVGSLVRPITKLEYESRSGAIPKQLFSHNDQTDSWLAANANGETGLGWAGRMMDTIYPGDFPAPAASLSIGGNSLWQKASNVRNFEVGTSGVTGRYQPNHAGPMKLRDAYAAMHANAVSQSNLFANSRAMVLERALDYADLINTSIESSPTFQTAFTGGRLAAQLEMVARLISARASLGSDLNRQIFFVRLGGWDTHDNQIAGVEDETHQALLGQLDAALGAFQNAMVQLGVQDSVTAFTATEFGRSLTPNSSGTDHGWGGHSLVMGGAVQGGDIYGQMPQISLDSVDTVNNSRFVPTTSVEQYSATLARWFGLSDSELNSVFPNLGNFATPDVGFMG